MDRRHFLKAAATAPAAVAVTGPIILGADDKAGTKLPVVGTGEHTYECHHYWGELPSGFEWQTTHNVAVDAAGLVYITHQGMGRNQVDTVLVFEPSGKFVRSFGKGWWGGGHGLDVRNEVGQEFLYLANTYKNPKVVKTDLKGEVVWKKERPEAKEYENPSVRYNPTNVAFAPDGGFYVADGYGSHYVQKYDADGKLVKTIRGSGNKDGQFNTPHGLWLDTRDPAKTTLVVCDRANARLQTFTPDLEFISATQPRESVLLPANIDIRGDVMLVPDLQARVSLFGKDGKVLAHLADDEAWRTKVMDSRNPKKANGSPEIRSQPKEWPAGKFIHPHDACFDKDGNIFVVEYVTTGRVTFLKKV